MLANCEVYYFLGGIPYVRTAIGNLVSMLAPEGRLVSASARDAACLRWGTLLAET
ncbi:SAM-dependent methyltransferase [Mesorhizobium sp. 128a]